MRTISRDTAQHLTVSTETNESKRTKKLAMVQILWTKNEPGTS